MRSTKVMQVPVLAGAVLALGGLATATPVWADSPVPEGQMQKYCMGMASEELGENPQYISTEPVQKRGKEFVVNGQTAGGGGRDGTHFECLFGKRGMFKGVTVTGSSYHSGGNSSSDSVPEYQMQKYCMGMASEELGENPQYISTEPVQRRGSDYVVYGQTPQSGYDVTKFECVFGSRGDYRGVNVTSRGNSNSGGNSYGGGNDSNEIPWSAKNKCLEMFADRAEITDISPLRPGYWEVIMQSKDSPRAVACTVSSNDTIEDWIELN